LCERDTLVSAGVCPRPSPCVCAVPVVKLIQIVHASKLECALRCTCSEARTKVALPELQGCVHLIERGSTGIERAKVISSNMENVRAGS